MKLPWVSRREFDVLTDSANRARELRTAAEDDALLAHKELEALRGVVGQLNVHIEELREERNRTDAAFRSLVDSVLFGAGHTPVFDPENKRFETLHPDIKPQRAAGMKAAEWRAEMERRDRETAAEVQASIAAKRQQAEALLAARGEKNGNATNGNA